MMVNKKKLLILSFLAIFLFNSFLQGNSGNYNNYTKKYINNIEPYPSDIPVGSYRVPGVSRSIPLDQLVKIGLLDDMNYISGEHAWNGALLAAREINEGGGILVNGTHYYIGLVSENTNEYTGTISDGIEAANRMINDHHPQFITGGYWWPLLSYVDVIMDNKTPFINTGFIGSMVCDKVLNDYERYKYFFKIMPYNSTAWVTDVITYTIYLANYLNITYGGTVDKIAIIRNDDPFTLSLSNALNNFFPDNEFYNFTIVEEKVFPDDATSEDFATYWSDIETAGTQIALSCVLTQQVELVDQQYQAVEPDCILYDLSAYTPGHLASYWDDTSGACQFKIGPQSIHNTSKTPLTMPFWNNYIEEYGVEPLFTGTGSYSAVKLLAYAVNESHSFDSDIIVSTLENINVSNPFTTPAHNLAFTHSHDLRAGPSFAHSLFCQWKYIDGTKVILPTGGWIYPDSIATGSLRLPYWGINGLLTDPPDPPGDFTSKHDADTPDYDYDGEFNLNWTDSESADNYSIYMSDKPITYISKKFEQFAYQTATPPFPISLKQQGDYYFMVVAYNETGETMSDNYVHVTIPGPGYFSLTDDADDPDTDGDFNLIWTTSERADNYSVYQHDKMITEINGSLTRLAHQTTATSFPVTGLSNGEYYFVVVAWNEMGLTLSDEIRHVIVRIPSGGPDIFPIAVISIISAGSVIGIAYIWLKKRYPKHKGKIKHK